MNSSQPPSSRWVGVGRAFALLHLAAGSLPVSQLSLSPVYGSIPASIYHQSIIGVILVFIFSLIPSRTTRSPTIANSLCSLCLPVLACYVPTLQFFLFQHSSSLGPIWGPVVTEMCTYLPFAVISLYEALLLFDRASVNLLNKFARRCLISALVAGYVWTFTRLMAKPINHFVGSYALFTRQGFELIIAGVSAILFPSKLLLLCLPSLLHTVLYNYHVPLFWGGKELDKALAGAGFSLQARKDSLTGYISVLENAVDGFRALRCDHSLLGGQWLPQDGQVLARVSDPIYAVFVMLEAVRLLVPLGVNDGGAALDAGSKNALVIGLGIGTTPAALIQHGINTTIVEIDPVVYEFATDYFALPTNHTAVIQDAVSFVHDARASPDVAGSYDYIIHDVFTGGAEPIPLFTQEFFQGLWDLLKEDGAIAINCAADLRLPTTAVIVNTIFSVFPTCRLFRDLPATDEDGDVDFTNLVIFCTKAASSAGFTFREPVEEDFLGSPSRREFLMPQHEVDRRALGDQSESRGILRVGNEERLMRWQTRTAVGHWRIMRTVLPPLVWEAY